MRIPAAPRTDIGAAAYFLAVAVITTLPMVAHIGTGLAGYVDGDAFDHLWGYHWFARSLVTEGRFPSATTWLGYPFGGRLYFIDVVGALITAPFAWFPSGLYLGYNLLQLAQLTLAGWLTWRLCLREGAHLGGALVGGTIFAASAFLQSTVFNGVPEMGNAYVVPLSLLAMRRVMDEPGWRAVVLMGGAIALAALSSWYYGIFMVFAGMIYVPWRLSQAPGGSHVVLMLLRLGVGGSLGVFAAAPFALRFLSTLYQADSLIERSRGQLASTPALGSLCNDLLLGFAPGTSSNTNYGGFSTFIHTAFPGVVALTLVALLVLQRRWRTGTAVWLALAGVSWILSFGPYLFVWRARLDSVPLPWETVSRLVPVLDQIWFPYRYAVLVQISLAVLAALAVTRMCWWLPVRLCPLVPAVLAPLVLAEQLTTSPVPWPRPIASVEPPDYLALLETTRTAEAVLDLPYPDDALGHQMCLSHYSLHQSWHERPMPYSVNFSEPPTRIDDNAFLGALARVRQGASFEKDLVEAAGAGLADLYEMGFRHVVVHTELYDRYPELSRRTRGQQVLALLDTTADLVGQTEQAVVYRIREP